MHNRHFTCMVVLAHKTWLLKAHIML